MLEVTEILPIDPQTPIENIYEFAAALYLVAEREAHGYLPHWRHKPKAEKERIQRSAWEFANEWRDFFYTRLGPFAQPDLFPQPTPQTERPTLDRRGAYHTTKRVAAHIAAHGPATAPELAAVIGCTDKNMYYQLSRHPELFKIVGYGRTAADKKIKLWGLANDDHR